MVNQNLFFPLLPLREIVLYPRISIPIFVGRERSVQAIEQGMVNYGRALFFSAQKDAKLEDPAPNDIYTIGTIGTILQLLRLPDGTVKVLIEGTHRAAARKITQKDGSLLADVVMLENEQDENPEELEALIRITRNTFNEYFKLHKKLSKEVALHVSSIVEPDRLAYTLAFHMPFKLKDKQAVLEQNKVSGALELVYSLMELELQVNDFEQRIKARVKKQMEKSQKDYYLNEQIKAIHKEIGSSDDFQNDLAEIERRIKKKRLTKEAAERIRHEFKKLKFMPPMSAESTVVRNYIDWILALPWHERTKDRIDIDVAEKLLSDDHYALEKPKERILEYLAVQSLVKKIKGPILCLTGPPGVGKTSLARSVANAIGRNFVRLSLGGVRDEAEIRGHRRTYIGAMPGKIIQSLKKARTANPVFCLDEIDKMSSDFRGDPASALLEVLDPEQNFSFNDHYLDMDYDLSDILFITTANSLHTIPPPLLDRMEVIQIAGYTEEEKLEIARGFLIPKQLKANGLKDELMLFSDTAILSVIRMYTREAGVRNLDRTIASVCRKIAKEVARNKSEKNAFRISAASLEKYLGPAKYQADIVEEKDLIGVASGLAWTETGGSVLHIEATMMPGKGALIITGKLGDVMQESVRAAMSYVRSRAGELGLPLDFYQNIDIHVHVPEGAIPKDGPSAGITIATAVVSALLRIPVKKNVAMTGEITLRGRVLPIGGLKEKLLAARRIGIDTVLIPQKNEKDLKEIPAKLLRSMEIAPVETMDEVLTRSLAMERPDELFAGQNMLNIHEWCAKADYTPCEIPSH